MKLQILELPTEYVGDYSHTPYAVILSEVPKESVEAVTAAFKNLTETVKDLSWSIATDLEVEL